MHVFAILYNLCMYKRIYRRKFWGLIRPNTLLNSKPKEWFFSKQKSGYSNNFQNLSLSYEVNLGLICVYMNDDISREAQNFVCYKFVFQGFGLKGFWIFMLSFNFWGFILKICRWYWPPHIWQLWWNMPLIESFLNESMSIIFNYSSQRVKIFCTSGTREWA